MTEASPERANMGFIGAIVAVATIGGFLFGYDSGAVNGTQHGLTEAFDLSRSFSPENGLGFTVGSLLIGCFIGAFFAGRLADVMGRRNVMLLAALLFLVGALVQGFADDHSSSSSPASSAAWRSARPACCRPPISPKSRRRASAAG